MTFLEYVCERLIGPPAWRSGTYGESYWNCPFHDDTNPSFHTMPHKPEYKDRWRCFGCGMRGDEADLMQGLMPPEPWPARKARLDQWRQEYERAVLQVARQAEPINKPAKVFLSGEAGRLADPNYDHPLEVGAAWSDLTEDERDTLIAALAVMRQEKVAKAPVSFNALAEYCLDFVQWKEESAKQHVSECTDPEHCDDAPCRKARGLPPLTIEQIQSGLFEGDGHVNQRTR